MAKFSNGTPSGTAVLETTNSSTITYEGAPAFSFTEEAELLLLAASNMVGEHTFYQSANGRDSRYRDLIHKVTASNPAFISGNETRQGLASYLRSDLKMRSAAIVMAAEYIKAGGANGRKVVNSVLQRADEPSELLGYWISNYGRRIPQPIKRGIADSLPRLWNEASIMKYDSSRHAVRFADVIELTHPRGNDKSSLFRYLLDERHDHVTASLDYGLPMIKRQLELERLDPEQRKNWLLRNGMPQGWTWERLSGWISPMDAMAWEIAIPQMGVMALLRNLRNFDQAGISDKAVDQVIAKITNKENVEASRIWPLNVYAAYRESTSDNYKRALARTLEMTVTTLPELDASTLILVDVSGSMIVPLSQRSTLQRAEAASIIGAALAFRTHGGTLAAFGNHSQDVQYVGYSVLGTAERITGARFYCGGGTDTARAVQEMYSGQKRIIVITDEQTLTNYSHIVGQNTFLHVFDLAGYGRASMEFGKSKRFVYGGFSDSLFSLLPIVEHGLHAGWPF